MISRSRLRRSLRRARRPVGLATVGALAIPLIAANNAVAVNVDGEELDVRTYAATVGDVLDELEVEVEPADEVEPAPDTPLSDGLEIAIARAVEVDVVVDGEHVDTVHEPVVSVAGVVEAADLGDVRDQGALISPGWTQPVESGDVVEIALPTEVSVTADGDTLAVETHATDVAGLLLEQDIELGDDDRVTPDLDHELGQGDEVVVERVGFDEVVEEVVLERGEQRRETDRLERGTTRVEDEGADGLRRDVYRIERVDGEEVARELVERDVVREPRDRIVLVGTRTPPPTPASSVSGNVWDRLAQCESGGNWGHRGGQYHGGLQFHPDTWTRHKPAGYPTYAYEASREQQIVVGERVRARQGWSAWPHCSRKLGLR